MSQYIICHGINLLDLEDFSKIFNNFLTNLEMSTLLKKSNH